MGGTSSSAKSLERSEPLLIVDDDFRKRRPTVLFDVSKEKPEPQEPRPIISPPSPIEPSLAAAVLHSDDTLRLIFGFVSPGVWHVLASVCRSWRRVARDDRVLWMFWTAARIPWRVAEGQTDRANFLRCVKALISERMRTAKELIESRGRRVIENSPRRPFGDEESRLPLPPVPFAGRLFFSSTQVKRCSLEEALRPEIGPPLATFELHLTESREPEGPMGFRYDRSFTVKGTIRVDRSWRADLRPTFAEVSHDGSSCFEPSSGRTFHLQPSDLSPTEDLHLSIQDEGEGDGMKKWSLRIGSETIRF